MNIDLSFFEAVQGVWLLFFGFFPSWFQASLGVCLGTYIAIISVKLVKFLKDLLWPF